MRRHLSYANVTATLALFLAASTGGAVAATKLIDSKAIKNNSVTGTDIKDGSVGPKDLSAAAKVSGPAGAKGDTGAAGPTGPTGAEGRNGALNLKVAGSKISTGTLELDFGSVSNGSCKTVSSTSLVFDSSSTHVITDDVVAASPKAPLQPGLVYSATPRGTNQIEVTVCNVGGAATVAQGTTTFLWSVIATK